RRMRRKSTSAQRFIRLEARVLGQEWSAVLLLAHNLTFAASGHNISNLLSVEKTSPAFDRVNRVIYSYVRLTNVSMTPVEGKVRLVVTDSSLPLTDVPNSQDGNTAAGEPFYWLNNGELIRVGPGETTEAIRVNFVQQRAPLTFDTRVEIVALAVRLVGAAGGTLEVGADSGPLSGALLEIPQGALEEATLLSIDIDENAPPFAAGDTGVGPAIRLNPGGISFLLPVSLRIPYSDTALEAVGIIEESDLGLYYFYEQQRIWTKVRTTRVAPDENELIAQLDHFSTYKINGDKLISMNDYFGVWPAAHNNKNIVFVHGIQLPFHELLDFIQCPSSGGEILSGLLNNLFSF
ncbi:MAG: hypothetical protein IH628_05020, partial [Proteobacteria bacterium]|nr:hypothetical protein [Pseudomonadota bacterium]